MKQRWLALAAAVVLTACGGDTSADRQTAVDTLTRRQKDSLLSTAPVAGAGRIGDALQAVDRANARVEAHDTIG